MGLNLLKSEIFRKIQPRNIFQKFHFSVIFYTRAMDKYDHKTIEQKWQEVWDKTNLYTTSGKSEKPKFYALDMFPYISGSGIHVGHPKGYIATDVISRFKMLQGFNVLHPMGWDAFGLPAENYAIKNKINPNVFVKEHINKFREQLKIFGFTYDWDREFSTTDPEYYKWTQWIFLKMFEKGLAYESDEPVNWCPNCKTVLANEDLENGLCERCGAQVVQKKMRQWVLRMTNYADRLLYDLDNSDLDWEELIKQQQRNWIGRSEGAQFAMKVSDSDEKIEVYTTRIDTVFGMTYAVAAPEHKIIEKLKDKIENYEDVEKYLIQAQNKTNLERTDLQKEKTGVELQGIKVINPFNNEEIPLFVADYVLGFYGTGAVMAVPAHDERDFDFAKKYNLPIKQSIASFHKAEKAHPDAFREDKDTKDRDVVYVILKHWSEDKYLCLDWKYAEHWTSMVVGGIEKGETLEEAGKRELEEETGYKNFKFKGEIDLSEIHSLYFAGHKDENRYAKARGVYFELINGEQNEIDENEKKMHDLVWVKKNEVDNFMTFSNWKILWDIFIGKVKAFVEDGIVINSENYSGLTSQEAREKMTEWLEKEKIGSKKVNYKMRDWVFSRQRYWGEPIPIVHCEKCGAVPVPEKDLPLVLPQVESYEPSGTGESPLANISEWVNTACPKCGGKGRRETNTMPQWAGSCWYYLRYIDPKNDNILVDKEKEKYWMPVDLYVGGAEHATRHLLYARFWHKFLYDIGAVSTTEPFKKLVHVGLINAEDGRKMSKRWGNVVNPDDVVGEFGADAMRLYEMFMGPFSQSVAWSMSGVSGIRRFLEKVWKLQAAVSRQDTADSKIQSLIHKTIKKVTEDIENFRFNTAISQLMILANAMEKEKALPVTDYRLLITILSPFAPHIAEEIWSQLGNKESIFKEKWPVVDEKYLIDEEVEMVVQINGKLRDRIFVAPDVTEDEAKEMALQSEKARSFIGNSEIKKIVFVSGRLINIVI